MQFDIPFLLSASSPKLFALRLDFLPQSVSQGQGREVLSLLVSVRLALPRSGPTLQPGSVSAGVISDLP